MSTKILEPALLYCEPGAEPLFTDEDRQLLESEGLNIQSDPKEVYQLVSTGKVYHVFFLLAQESLQTLALISDICALLSPLHENVVIVSADPSYALQQTMLEWDIRTIWGPNGFGDHVLRYLSAIEAELNSEDATSRLVFSLSQEILNGNMSEFVNLLALIKPHVTYDYRAAYVSGCCAQFVGRLDEAQGYFEQSLQLNTRFMHAKKSLLALNLLQNKIGEAEKWLEEILKVNPKSAETLIIKAHMLADKGQWGEAETTLEVAKDFNSECSQILEVEIRLDINKGDFLSALEKLKNLKGLSDYIFSKINEAAVSLSRSGQSDLAIDFYQSAHEISPRHSKFKISFNMALAHKRKGEFEIALRLLDRTEQECPFKPFDKITKQRELLLQEMAKK